MAKIVMTPTPPVTVTVRIETPKGIVSRSIAVSEAGFRMQIPFGTFSSFSPFFGERCKNRPTAVIVAARQSENVLGETKLSFKQHATASAYADHTIRGKIVVEASGVRLTK